MRENWEGRSKEKSGRESKSEKGTVCERENERR